MALLLRFEPAQMSVSQYVEVMKRVEDAGWGAPPGRLYHVCYGELDKLQVIDVWETEEQRFAYYEVLVPIAIELGITPAEPTADSVLNILEG